LLSLFALVWLSNIYMGGLRTCTWTFTMSGLEIKSKNLDLESKAEDLESNRAA
jgi:hypothetical protein